MTITGTTGTIIDEKAFLPSPILSLIRAMVFSAQAGPGFAPCVMTYSSNIKPQSVDNVTRSDLKPLSVYIINQDQRFYDFSKPSLLCSNQRFSRIKKKIFLNLMREYNKFHKEKAGSQISLYKDYLWVIIK
jgi:hypothetical protein